VKKTGKTEAVEALKGAIAAQRGAVVASFRGMTVAEMTALRKKLREARAEFKVVKNTMIRLAARGTPFEQLSGHFKGPTALAFTHGDPVVLARTMKEFSAGSPKITVRGGYLDGRVLSAQEVQALADVPPREVLLSRLVGGLASPITRLAQALSTPQRKLAFALDAVRRRKPAEATAG
jgi:large subunit ribosomal protein L10